MPAQATAQNNALTKIGILITGLTGLVRDVIVVINWELAKSLEDRGRWKIECQNGIHDIENMLTNPY